jgi:hypothetical protein
MEPAEAINVVESVLRQAITQVLGIAWSASFALEELECRRTEEAKSRNGAVVEEDLLAYMHLYELRKIIVKAWASFKPIFNDQKRFNVYMDRLEDFRNAPMHSRTLLPFERDLLAGIAGELRNSLTLWRSQKAPDMTWYPVVESITDSLGNDLSSATGNVVVPARLQVGDELTFRCVGSDPQNRVLTWTLSQFALGGPELDRATGAEATLTWRVTEVHVAETCIVVIRMQSDGKYHRFTWGGDFSLSAFYTVDPPS